jgi:hypothetical protein
MAGDFIDFPLAHGRFWGMFQSSGGAELTRPIGVQAMSDLPVSKNAQAKSLWQYAALILSVVFAPAALACLVMLLRH